MMTGNFVFSEEFRAFVRIPFSIEGYFDFVLQNYEYQDLECTNSGSRSGCPP